MRRVEVAGIALRVPLQKRPKERRRLALSITCHARNVFCCKGWDAGKRSLCALPWISGRTRLWTVECFPHPFTSLS